MVNYDIRSPRTKLTRTKLKVLDLRGMSYTILIVEGSLQLTQKNEVGLKTTDHHSHMPDSYNHII